MRKLDKHDEKELRRFLNIEPHANLFLLGDLDAFGFDEMKQTFYGFFKDKELVAVIFTYLDDSIHGVIHEMNQAIIIQLKELIQLNKYAFFNCTEKTMNHLDGRIDSLILEKRKTIMSVYTPKSDFKNDDEVFVLNENHSTAIVDLENLCFGLSNRSLKQVEDDLFKGNRMSYGMFYDNQLVAIASAVAETDFSVMVVGVATHPDYRNKGFASRVVKKMSDDYYKRGKQAVLFYNNPQAASIYERLGYEPLENYIMNKIKI
ncbi:GNAT family N-acetyltransferase [Erysipelothrix urinaevulpis]|uniref:GNAT family N-acetyltransferase n=1 Tax=Erysipelothrix urinaevulpis TaxID=2683717 RepID=UPI001359489E|nr:GNAT family N-acetyltransferase [Erysipelothrix urinaevulpis]